MEEKIKKENEEAVSNDWKGMVQTFVTNMIARASDNISEKIKKWVENLKRRTSGVILMLLGLVFALVSLAIYINTVVDNGSQWAGYGGVGIVIFIIGYVMSRE